MSQLNGEINFLLTEILPAELVLRCSRFDWLLRFTQFAQFLLKLLVDIFFFRNPSIVSQRSFGFLRVVLRQILRWLGIEEKQCNKHQGNGKYYPSNGFIVKEISQSIDDQHANGQAEAQKSAQRTPESVLSQLRDVNGNDRKATASGWSGKKTRHSQMEGITGKGNDEPMHLEIRYLLSDNYMRIWLAFYYQHWICREEQTTSPSYLICQPSEEYCTQEGARKYRSGYPAKLLLGQRARIEMIRSILEIH